MNDIFAIISLWFYILLTSGFCIWFFVMLEKAHGENILSHEQTITILSLRMKELKDLHAKKEEQNDVLLALLDQRNDRLADENEALKKRLNDLTSRRTRKTVALSLPETPYSTGPLPSSAAAGLTTAS
jgi:FtsZ-binding cell division protein ZapB